MRELAQGNREFGFEENRFIVWLRENEELCDAAISLAAFGLCLYCPLYAIPIVLGNGICIKFIQFLVKKNN